MRKNCKYFEIISNTFFEYLRCKNRMQKMNICIAIFEYLVCNNSETALQKFDICDINMYICSAVALQKMEFCKNCDAIIEYLRGTNIDGCRCLLVLARACGAFVSGESRPRVCLIHCMSKSSKSSTLNGPGAHTLNGVNTCCLLE